VFKILGEKCSLKKERRRDRPEYPEGVALGSATVYLHLVIWCRVAMYINF
jgi:hypothetical protein